MSQLEFEFQCDADLEPLVSLGSISRWQALAITSQRDVLKLRERLAELEKKMESPAEAVTLKPVFRG